MFKYLLMIALMGASTMAFAKTEVAVKGMFCDKCKNKVEKMVKNMPGLPKNLKVIIELNKITIDDSDTALSSEQLQKVIAELEAEVKKHKDLEWVGPVSKSI